ncbi:F-box/kelch-repeat protein OR23 [Hibiscus syriacus]|uniref:F-box/kelch-repeat protein OR23 n=1 Tax=Hibiscus syriacus TaxID=106335 RepID=A0A6A3C409_HIBSY|nr:F-box/kelch-repeat protein OR23 [Hibiscus syriacus]
MPCNPHEYGLCNFTSISLGPHIYVLGGSLLDTLSFSLDRPSPSSSTFRYNFVTSSWDRLAPMISPRGSFACAAILGSDQIIVAGGGSRHTMFRAAGISGDGEETEFWVMGGYGDSRTVSGVFPVDEYYKDALVMELKENGDGKWRELGDMWETGETPRFSKIVVVEDEEGCYPPAIFMLDDYDILR